MLWPPVRLDDNDSQLSKVAEEFCGKWLFSIIKNSLCLEIASTFRSKTEPIRQRSMFSLGFRQAAAVCQTTSSAGRNSNTPPAISKLVQRIV